MNTKHIIIIIIAFTDILPVRPEKQKKPKSLIFFKCYMIYNEQFNEFFLLQNTHKNE